MYQEHNILIAEFLLIPFKRKEYYIDLKWKKGNIVPDTTGDDFSFFIKKDLRFNNSWDWLMPVVAKIVPPHGWIFKLVKAQSNVMLMVQYANINDTYRAVVDFIKDYNKYEKCKV